ncbi:hypothetical protein ACE1ET_16380 [Saccharicrinis sp. FJH62]|uniref:hypothetical protein n=1 Tax=Saccharicrinis sp. FJH62 TaxID=3344657 RepID=UPI0035D40506
MKEIYIAPSQEAGRDFVLRGIKGPVVMLNLLRFRETADYSASPELEPEKPISGKEAYQLYIDHTLPFLKESGGEIMFLGEGGKYLIGPSGERWDLVMLIKQKNVERFLNFESHKDYQKGIGHRTAALEDSRLLPVAESKESGKLIFQQ